MYINNLFITHKSNSWSYQWCAQSLQKHTGMSQATGYQRNETSKIKNS